MTRRALLVGVLVAAAAPWLPESAPAQLRPQFQHAADATVLIEATWEIRARFQGEERKDYFGSNGSGFLVAPQGIILTNNHVVDARYVEDEVKREFAEAARWVDIVIRRVSMSVRAFSGTDDEIERPASILRLDRKNDLAVLSVNFGRPMPYLKIHAPVTLQVGAPVAVSGFPANSVVKTLVPDAARRGSVVSVSQGRVTAVRRDRQETTRLLQLDAAVTGGNSGGPVVNLDGSVVGVLTSTVGAGVNFAVAGDTVIEFVENYLQETDRPIRNAASGQEQGSVPADAGEVVVHLKNGAKERGTLKRRTADGITLQLPGLGTIRYSQAEIQRIEPAGE